MKKKKNKWLNMPIVIIITFLVPLYIFGSLFRYFGDFPYNEERQCKNKRFDWVKDNCVCEVKGYENLPNKLGIADISKCLEGSSLTKLRKKTQDELLIDDCNNNPREDISCNCEKWGEPQYNLTGYKSPLGEVIVQNNKGVICGQESYNSWKNSPYQPIYTNQTKCIKSRPKTDREKHPENYIGEVKEVINEEWLDNCCEDIQINVGNGRQTYKANKICFEANSSAFGAINSINTTNCEQTPKFVNKTVYRSKTQCEKRNPDWVEETKLELGEEISIPCSDIIEGDSRQGCTFTPFINQTILNPGL